ncbi:hypothetical protein EDB89DRAFT_1977827 [Lactarius sanguifluus]|nr:hypothetical protein EDB89DRAFT_1977827 [Lactarius sanguifluus]
MLLPINRDCRRSIGWFYGPGRVPVDIGYSTHVRTTGMKGRSLQCRERLDKVPCKARINSLQLGHGTFDHFGPRPGIYKEFSTSYSWLTVSQSNTRLAGSPQGTFLDDLTNRTTQAIKKINRIVVYSGEVIDSVRITYDVEKRWHYKSADDKLLAVYGSRLLTSSLYGDKTITKLSFVVANFTGSAPTVQVYTASGTFATPAQNAKFELSWPLSAASSYSYQPTGLDRAFVQAIGFSNALGTANPTFL